MRSSLLLTLALCVPACGGSAKPAPANTTTTPTTTPETKTEPSDGVVTADECTSQGGTVKWDPGDGSGQCDSGFYSVADVGGGDENGLCCKQTPDNAE